MYKLAFLNSSLVYITYTPSFERLDDCVILISVTSYVLSPLRWHIFSKLLGIHSRVNHTYLGSFNRKMGGGGGSKVEMHSNNG